MPDTAEHRIELPYGGETVTGRLDGVDLLGTIDVKDVPALHDPYAAVRQALDQPTGLNAPLLSHVKPGESVLLVVSDAFRNTRADLMLPPLLDALNEYGVEDGAVEVLFSTGTHRSPSPEEQRAILGDHAYERLRGRLYCHDAHDAEVHVRVGVTSRGTPVEVNRKLFDADHVIVTGTVVLHYFGGFGGGRKSIVPGLASAEAIAHNHAMNLHPTEDKLDLAVRIGVLDGNPVSEDMFEAAKHVPVEGILHTVLNRSGEIAAVFAGELDQAHRAACAFARELYAVPIDRRADLVIAASPHTANFVQTHKALYNAYQAVKATGRIVLAAPCPEGLGGEQFTQWLDLRDRPGIIAALRRRSEINGQTALSTLEKAEVTLFVTDLSDHDVQRLGGLKCANLQQALDLAIAEIKDTGIRVPTVYQMPSATYTVPVPSDDK